MVGEVTSVLNVLDRHVPGGSSLDGLGDGQAYAKVIDPPEQEDWDGVVQVRLDTPTDLPQDTPVVVDGRGQGSWDREKGRDTGSS